MGLALSWLGNNRQNGLPFFFSSRRRHARFDCDWSSDVCSSDLTLRGAGAAAPAPARPRWSGVSVVAEEQRERAGGAAERPGRDLRRRAALSDQAGQIGRAACRGRVEISGGAGSLKKK